MPSQKSTDPDDSSSKPFVFSWRRFGLHAGIVVIGLMLGWLTWLFSKPQSVRFYETRADEYMTVAVTPEIEIALDNSSSIAVTDIKPTYMELFKGNVYFNVKQNMSTQFKIKVGEALVEDVGTRFSIRKHNDSSIVSVAEGQLKIHVASGTYLISAQEQADFDNFKISRHRMISEKEVAPWTSIDSTGL